MPPGRFITLFVLVSTAVTSALLLGRAAARQGDSALMVATVLAGVIAGIGLVILARAVVVVEREGRRR